MRYRSIRLIPWPPARAPVSTTPVDPNDTAGSAAPVGVYVRFTYDPVREEVERRIRRINGAAP